MIDVPETQDPQCERGRVVVDKCADAEHPAWCSAEHCYVTDEGVRVHEQAPIRWEDDTAEVRFESCYSIRRTSRTSTSRSNYRI